MTSILAWVYYGAILSCSTDAAQILGLFPYNGRSHFVMFEALLKALTARGHQVDVLSHFPQKIPVPNYTDFNVEQSLRPVMNNLPMTTVETFNSFSVLRFIINENINVCKEVYKHPEVQKLLHSEKKYDLIITEIFGTDCFLGFVHKFQVPYISMISSVAQPWANDRVGNPDHPAYIPNYYLPYTQNMSLIQRLINTVFSIFVKWYYYFYSELAAQKVARQYFGESLPPLSEIANNLSLVFVNSHFSLHQPRPMVPAFVEVGGIHIQKPRSLPHELEQFINQSEHGVIYFSFGSMVQAETIAQDKLNSLLEAFKELPQRILWKCKGDHLQGLPANIRVANWLPQRDILAHSNVRLFITHGGLLGTQEAISSGVPMLGIPLFADQELNIENYVAQGMAVKLKYSSITKQTVLDMINTILSNSSYLHNSRRMSLLFRDRPLSPLETAVYWTEYVIRHGGAPHLRSAATNLSWHQYLLLDISLVVLSALLLLFTLVYIFLQKLKNKLNINYSKYIYLHPSKLKFY